MFRHLQRLFSAMVVVSILLTLCACSPVEVRLPAIQQNPPQSQTPPDDLLASGTVGDGISWKLDKEGTLTVSGAGAIPDYSAEETAPWSSFGSSIKTIVIGSGVTGIGIGSFKGCGSISRISIPGQVLTIGDEAFSDCAQLSGIDVSSDNRAYTSSDGVLFNKSLDSLVFCPEGYSGKCTIPASVTDIRDGAFRNCRNLQGIVFLGTYEQWSAVRIGSNNERLYTLTLEIPAQEQPERTAEEKPSEEESLKRVLDDEPEVITLSRDRKRVYTKYTIKNMRNFSIEIPSNWTAETKPIEGAESPTYRDYRKFFIIRDEFGNAVLVIDDQDFAHEARTTISEKNGIRVEIITDSDHHLTYSDTYFGYFGAQASHFFYSMNLTMKQTAELLSTVEFLGTADDYPVPSQTLSLNSYGDEVRYVQAALMELDYDGIVIDGDYGQYTKAAVERFQRNHNMQATGVVDSATVQELQDALVVWRRNHS